MAHGGLASRTPLPLAVERSPLVVERFFGGSAARPLGGLAARRHEGSMAWRIDGMAVWRLGGSACHLSLLLRRSPLFVERFFSAVRWHGGPVAFIPLSGRS